MRIGLSPSRRRSAQPAGNGLVSNLLVALVLTTTWACQSTEPASDPGRSSTPEATPSITGDPTNHTGANAATGPAAAAYTAAMQDTIPAALHGRELASRMKEVDNRFFDLDDALRRPRAEETRNELVRLVALLRSARESRAEEEFHQMADQALTAFGELAQQLDGDDTAARKRAYDRVAGRCDACHHKYRKR